MLSRLISLLRRIPAVKWAFTRLRPVPQGGSIDATPPAADVSSVIAQDIEIQDVPAQDVPAQDVPAQDIAEVASTQVAEISTASRLDEAVSEAAAPSAEDDAAISVIAESPPAAPTEAVAGDDSARHTPSDTEPVVEEKASAAEIETTAEDAPEPATSNEPVAAEAVAAVETSPSPGAVGRDPLDGAALVVDDDRSSDAIVDVERSGDAPCVTSADAEVLAEPVSETDFDSDPSPDDAAALAPVVAESAAPVAAVAAEHDPADTASVITEIAPAPTLVSPAPEVRSSLKVRARAAEPADRAALIRQRWAESGIRMWNPRLHGTGEATLNIQGSVGLLPPAPGETMPRYDKLEFRMLGGQIVCEGVIVDAPVQASQRSFTRLAEPAKLERSREPARERQAALA